MHICHREEEEKVKFMLFIHLSHGSVAIITYFRPVRVYHWTPTLPTISLAENDAMKSLLVISLLVLGMYPAASCVPYVGQHWIIVAVG